MAFTGTLQKCNACDKTVYVMDLLSADGISYHKHCFKCSHCKGTLVMSNYSSMDGVLYCKTHFQQLFQETGNFTKNFHAPAGKTTELRSEMSRTPSRLSALFSGTQDKCATCHKTAYPLEKVTVEGESYHKWCFKCDHGGCALTPSSYAALDGILYCKHHFAQLFKEKGSYNHLIKTATLRRNAAVVPEPTPTPTPIPTPAPASEPEPEPEQESDQTKEES
ncbi:hypothetical protein GIB67_008016 [Kingdonia uniflora]|uniref:LIM zinc-binding domain-containing protein n=1 Tax=Kingdonia uniflora TaxID=39325 RepID=A0A7J7MXN5_9MAGN|nr:hypothetical protein GIB67_008016 [Kingdonia uniflora]